MADRSCAREISIKIATRRPHNHRDLSPRFRYESAMTPNYKPLHDGDVAVWHFGQTKRPIDMVFCHANGFNALTYQTLFEPMDIHIAALDMRGHGLSRLTANPDTLDNWQIFADDIVAFFESHIDHSVILGGHSFGAASAILASPFLKDKIHGFIGFDPVSLSLPFRIPSQFKSGRDYMRKNFALAKQAGNRRKIFESREFAFSRYQGRGAFRAVPDAVLKDYLHAGLTPKGDVFELSCDPFWEQAIYTAQAHNIFKAAKHLPKVRKIIYAGKGAVSTPFTRWDMARSIGKQNLEFKPGFHHLFPLSEHDFCREQIMAIYKTV